MKQALEEASHERFIGTGMAKLIARCLYGGEICAQDWPTIGVMTFCKSARGGNSSDVSRLGAIATSHPARAAIHGHASSHCPGPPDHAGGFPYVPRLRQLRLPYCSIIC